VLNCNDKLMKLTSFRKEMWLHLGVFFLFGFGLLSLYSISSNLFPNYFIYILLAFIGFIFFSQVDFEIIGAFSGLLYIFSVIALCIPLIIGEVTRGAVRWIPVGSITIQPSEIVKPFLILFFAYFLASQSLNPKRFFISLVLLLIPLFLILSQPALGMTVLTLLGFVGALLAVGINKRIFGISILVTLTLLPFSWFILAPYQRSRVKALFFPEEDPYGAGYNSIQSMISVGSGKLFGRGLGSGVQTQLYFLPERHSDFIFASVSEEMGFVGSFILLVGVFFLLYRVVAIIAHSKNLQARAFASGSFLTLFAQSVIHIGMNMGLLPITGLTLPLVSAGGSSLVGTMIMLGMVVSAKKEKG
jgi:rod shape determining protein RodA